MKFVYCTDQVLLSIQYYFWHSIFRFDFSIIFHYIMIYAASTSFIIHYKQEMFFFYCIKNKKE